jgi:hypothetical protein
MDEALKQALRLCDLETGLLMQRVRKQRSEADDAAQPATEEKAALPFGRRTAGRAPQP